MRGLRSCQSFARIGRVLGGPLFPSTNSRTTALALLLLSRFLWLAPFCFLFSFQTLSHLASNVSSGLLKEASTSTHLELLNRQIAQHPQAAMTSFTHPPGAGAAGGSVPPPQHTPPLGSRFQPAPTGGGGTSPGLHHQPHHIPGTQYTHDPYDGTQPTTVHRSPNVRPVAGGAHQLTPPQGGSSSVGAQGGGVSVPPGAFVLPPAAASPPGGAPRGPSGGMMTTTTSAPTSRGPSQQYTPPSHVNIGGAAQPTSSGASSTSVSGSNTPSALFPRSAPSSGATMLASSSRGAPKPPGGGGGPTGALWTPPGVTTPPAAALMYPTLYDGSGASSPSGSYATTSAMSTSVHGGGFGTPPLGLTHHPQLLSSGSSGGGGGGGYFPTSGSGYYFTPNDVATNHAGSLWGQQLSHGGQHHDGVTGGLPPRVSTTTTDAADSRGPSQPVGGGTPPLHHHQSAAAPRSTGGSSTSASPASKPQPHLQHVPTTIAGQAATAATGAGSDRRDDAPPTHFVRHGHKPSTEKSHQDLAHMGLEFLEIPINAEELAPLPQTWRRTNGSVVLRPSPTATPPPEGGSGPSSTLMLVEGDATGGHPIAVHTRDLFLAQLPFHMKVESMQFVANHVVEGAPVPILHVAVHKKNGKLYDGCAFIKVAHTDADRFVHAMHKTLLFDEGGVWVARTPQAKQRLADYCTRMQHMSPQQRREVLGRPIPFSAMTAELAKREYTY